MDERQREGLIGFLVMSGALIVIFIIIVLVSSCAAPPPAPAPTPRPTATEVACRLASEQQVQAVQFGLLPGVTVEQVYGVPSPDHKNAWYLAAAVDGHDEPAVWIISGVRSSPGLIGAVNSTAREVSDYPDASRTDFLTTPLDRGARAAVSCANQ